MYNTPPVLTTILIEHKPQTADSTAELNMVIFYRKKTNLNKTAKIKIGFD